MILVPKPVVLRGLRTFHNNNSQYLAYSSTNGAGSVNYQELSEPYRMARLWAAAYNSTALAGPDLEINVYDGVITGTPVLQVVFQGDSGTLDEGTDESDVILEAGAAFAVELKTVNYTSGTVQWGFVRWVLEMEPVA